MKKHGHYLKVLVCPLELKGGTGLARKALMIKAQRKPKFKVRAYNRCPLCGRARAFLRKFGMCRICFRTMALNGELPGVRKASW